MDLKWILLILSITSNAFASILIKIALTHPNQLPSLRQPLYLFVNFPLVVGIFLYGFAFLFYTLSLKYFPLSVAHPVITSSAIALVAIISTLIIKEGFTIKTFIGLSSIIAGVLVLTSK